MGSFWSRFWSKGPDMKIVMSGLDASGKTTILYKLKLGEIVTTIPTIGFNVEHVEHKNISMHVWDVGGRDKIHALYRHYYQGANAFIFCVDANDMRDRKDEALWELQRALREKELAGVPLLVLANKLDLPNAMSLAEITEKLDLHKIADRKWYIQGTCAISGDGLYEGFDWLAKTIKQTIITKQTC